jgi:hypothetical protein
VIGADEEDDSLVTAATANVVSASLADRAGEDKPTMSLD